MKTPKSVVLKNIVKKYTAHEGKDSFHAVDGISLDIKPGEFVTLLGPSGCGKTTTLRMIAGFETPDSGDIFLDEEKINQLTPDKRDTSMVFQSYALFPHYNVFENVAYGLRIRKTPREEISRRVKNVLELTGLSGLASRRPNQLSGGQQQRVALARALIMEPGVLLFDEPLSNLDAKLRVYMRAEIRKITSRLGLTSIYVTHDQAEAMSISDRIIVMNKGKIAQIGAPQEIYQKPASEFVADFIGTANFLDGEVMASKNGTLKVMVLGKEVAVADNPEKPISAGSKVRIVARPEAIFLKDDGWYKGTVSYSTFMGNFQEYFIDAYGIMLNVAETNLHSHKTYREGDKVSFDLVEECLHCFIPQS